MKHTLTLGVIAVFAALTFSSCKKSWTCACTTTTSVNDSVITTGTSSHDFRGTKADAKNDCSNNSQTQTVLGFQLKTDSQCALQ